VPEFVKPDDFSFRVDKRRELHALRAHRETRGVPEKQDGRLLLATWNLANFDVQEREEVHLDLIAEILSWFDLIAVQEIRDDVTGLRGLKARLPRGWQILFSEAAGNDERQAFVYDSGKVAVGEKVGKITVPPPSLVHAGGEGFRGFDRNPYLAGFQGGDLTFLLANVHSIWGGSGADDLLRPTAETKAVAWWCDKRAKDPNAYSKDIFALGDFNLPKAATGDPVFDELTRRGLKLPEHQTVIGTTIAREEKQYDQVANPPRHSAADLTGNGGVFDYDAVLFHDLWEDRGDVDYDRYAKWAISDHRPLWTELKI
jgi:hypothetical protein